MHQGLNVIQLMQVNLTELQEKIHIAYEKQCNICVFNPVQLVCLIQWNAGM